MAASLTRRTLGVLSALLLAGLVLSGSAGTAHAADGYRYWNYFHLDSGSWAFSQVGGGEFVPEDGSVEGYRYGVSTSAAGIPPRADLDTVGFEEVCGGEEAAAGEKRVAVLIDYGTAADAEGATPPAPRAACAVVPEEATGQQVLETAAEVRAEGGLTCAIDGYPVQGCGVSVKNAQAPTDEQPVAFEVPGADDTEQASSETADDDSGLLWPLVGVGVLVLLIAAGALTLNRRKASS